jgi:acyl-CoA thioester hydrolase
MGTTEHTHQIRVIYGDTDKMGVVYYANYLRYFEAARNEYLRAVGYTYDRFEKEGYALPVVQAEVKYLRPAYYDDLLVVITRLQFMRRSSIAIEYAVNRPSDAETIATGQTVHACVDAVAYSVIRLPVGFREALNCDG